MTAKKRTKSGKRKQSHGVGDAESVVAAMVVGGVAGATAGPPGIVAGAILGAAAGAVAAKALEKEATEDDARTLELDEEIGISGGDLGAPNLKHPPAKSGAYSATSAGVAPSGAESPAEGPMQTPDS